jgi:hypothetical protein
VAPPRPGRREWTLEAERDGPYIRVRPAAADSVPGQEEGSGSPTGRHLPLSIARQLLKAMEKAKGGKPYTAKG